MIKIDRAENERTEGYKLSIDLSDHADKVWLADKMLKGCNAIANVIIEYVRPRCLFVESESKNGDLFSVLSYSMADNRHTKRITF